MKKKYLPGLWVYTSGVFIAVLCIFLSTGLYAQQNQPEEPTIWVSQAGSESPDYVPGRLLVKFKKNTSIERINKILAETKTQAKEKIKGADVHIIELPQNANEKALANGFKHFAEVEFAEVDQIVPPSYVVPNDPWFANQWHLTKIGAPNAWSYSKGSNTVIIAILDTGVDSTHPDLTNKLVPGWNMYNNNSDTMDVLGHGTAVAGTVAANTNNLIGIASLGWNCMLMPIRISDLQGYATYSAAANGLVWASDRGARVANISYRMSESSTIASAAKYFQDRGGVVTISAGNQSTFITNADNPYVLTVSATTSSDSLASFTNTGNIIDIAAPGVSIYTTTIPKDGYYYSPVAGTSFSAPVVAGVAALVISANPALTGAQAQDIIMKTADDLGPAGWDTGYGLGRVNALKAVEEALKTSGYIDTIPPSVGFTSPQNNATIGGVFTIQMNASDNISVQSVSLYINGALQKTFTSSPYSFVWDTTKVSNGIYTLKAVAADGTGNSSSVSITVTVNNISDTTAPSITITSPKNGDTVKLTTTISVSASDNVGVTKVELYVNGKLTATSTTAPFTLKWNTKSTAKGAHTLQCKAYDAAGNVGESNIVTVYK